MTDEPNPQPQPFTTSDSNAAPAGPLPPIDTGPLDAAARPPTHFPTKVRELLDLRRQIEEARIQGRIDTDTALAGLKLLDGLVELLSKIPGA